jgi:hypothetical protein
MIGVRHDVAGGGQHDVGVAAGGQDIVQRYRAFAGGQVAGALKMIAALGRLAAARVQLAEVRIVDRFGIGREPAQATA